MVTEYDPPFDPTDSNPDPITHEPGAHPVGTGLGAAYTGAIGTAVGGAFGGPVGAVVGAAVGAVAGGLLGKTAAESVNPTIEDEYWRTNYASRPYYETGRRYEDYEPAYRTGYEGYGRYAGRRYEEVEPDLRTDYETRRGSTGLAWDQARYATRDAWDRSDSTYARGDRTHLDPSVRDSYGEPVSPGYRDEHDRLHGDRRRVMDNYPENVRDAAAQQRMEQDRIAYEERLRQERSNKKF